MNRAASGNLDKEQECGPELIDAAILIRNLTARGVAIWVDNRNLRCKAPRGVLTRNDVSLLKEHKAHIVRYLTRSYDAVDDASPGNAVYRSPLSFSQLAHWNRFELRNKRSPCVIPTLTVIRGNLDVTRLKRCIMVVGQRHDALKTRIVLRNGIPFQEVHKSSHLLIESEDWTNGKVSDLEFRLQQLAGHAKSIDVLVDPLITISLLKLDRMEHALLVHMEHIICDGMSIGIFHNEIFTLYAQAVEGRDCSLPEPVQFAQYARRQQDLIGAFEFNATYLREKFRSGGRVRFPRGELGEWKQEFGTGSIRIPICRELELQLLAWCRIERTTLVMAVFTAYAALALRWCRVDEVVILYEIDGRTFEDLGPSIGYYAFPIYVRARAGHAGTFQELLSCLTMDYCDGYEHADFSYLESRVPRPDIASNCGFNWLPEISDEQYDRNGNTDDQLTISRVDPGEMEQFDGELDAEPMLIMRKGKDGLRATLMYSKRLTSQRTMQRFADNYVVFLRAMVTSAKTRIMEIALL